MEALGYDHNSYQVADRQMISREAASYWGLVSDNLQKYAATLDDNPFSGVMNACGSFAELCCLPDTLDSTSSFRFDSEDDIDGPDVFMMRFLATGEVSLSEVANTSRRDINKENARFNSFLESRSQDFIRSLIWADFEDGMENDITRQVAEYLKRNRFVTYGWLHKIFNENRSNPAVTSGILRTLVMVVNRGDVSYMLSIVTSGLSSRHLEDQEAAIMVVEKWRTKECLEALLNTTYGSEWVREYAMQVAAELKVELGV